MSQEMMSALFPKDKGEAFQRLKKYVGRADINPVDEALALYNACFRFDIGPEEIASQVGKSSRHVFYLLAILNLPVPALAALKNDFITMAHAKQILDSKYPKLMTHAILTNDRFGLEEAINYYYKIIESPGSLDNELKYILEKTQHLLSEEDIVNAKINSKNEELAHEDQCTYNEDAQSNPKDLVPEKDLSDLSELEEQVALASIFERADEISEEAVMGKPDPDSGYQKKKRSNVGFEPAVVEWLKTKTRRNHFSHVNSILRALMEVEQENAPTTPAKE